MNASASKNCVKIFHVQGFRENTMFLCLGSTSEELRKLFCFGGIGGGSFGSGSMFDFSDFGDFE